MRRREKIQRIASGRVPMHEERQPLPQAPTLIEIRLVNIQGIGTLAVSALTPA